jgi:DNA polymerase V
LGHLGWHWGTLGGIGAPWVALGHLGWHWGTLGGLSVIVFYAKKNMIISCENKLYDIIYFSEPDKGYEDNFMKVVQDKAVFLVGDVVAGFPSPAETYRESPLDLNRLLVYRPAATFFVRACGDSMMGAGIQDGDILVVDKSLTARDGSIIIASVGGDFTVKTYRIDKRGSHWLVPANSQFRPIALDETSDFSIFGVVTAVIHQYVHEPVRQGGIESDWLG